MEIMKLKAGQSQSAALTPAVNILRQEGVVCLPCNGSYRLFADVTSQAAVMRLIQSKRRVKKAPSLVFVDEVERLHQVVDEVPELASALMKELWPSPLTIRFKASKSLPRKVVKELTKATGSVGVRVPQSPLSRKVAKTFGGPLLVSSANRGRKGGERSPAQVRQNFLGRIDFFLDAGDLDEVPSSTVVDIKGDKVKIVRQGLVPKVAIDEVVEEMQG